MPHPLLKRVWHVRLVSTFTTVQQQLLISHSSPLAAMTQNTVYSEPPPLSPDVPLRIYSNPICPFVQRVRLLAAAKGIKTEEINIHLRMMPKWYVEKINPVGKVPTIEHNGHLIRESLIAFDYIDEVFPGGSYWPEDPYWKAMARLFVIDFDNDFIPNYYKHYNQVAQESHTQKLVDFVAKIEQGLKRHAEHSPGVTAFLGGMGGKPRAVDYLVWPWLERLPAIMLLNETLVSLITKDKFPRFFEYTDHMKQDEAVKQSYTPPEAYLAYLKSARNGALDYSIVDVEGTGLTIYARKTD